MKAETFYPISKTVVSSLITRILELTPDTTIQVKISNTGTKSDKQRGLDWTWNTEISQAGIGGKHEDTKKGVHLACKWRFGVPILRRDDDFFAALYVGWLEKHKGDEEAIMWFIDHHVSTEALTVSQMAEYLTAKEMFYSSKGVNLTDPQFKGLL